MNEKEQNTEQELPSFAIVIHNAYSQPLDVGVGAFFLCAQILLLWEV